MLATCRAHRSELLLSVYRRHFTMAGVLRARVLGDAGLTDDNIQEMAEAFYNCTACRRCYFECPMGIDHGLLTHLGRYILSEIGIVPRALAVSVREQLVGATRQHVGGSGACAVGHAGVPERGDQGRDRRGRRPSRSISRVRNTSSFPPFRTSSWKPTR